MCIRKFLIISTYWVNFEEFRQMNFWSVNSILIGSITFFSVYFFHKNYIVLWESVLSERLMMTVEIVELLSLCEWIYWMKILKNLTVIMKCGCLMENFKNLNHFMHSNAKIHFVWTKAFAFNAEIEFSRNRFRDRSGLKCEDVWNKK